MKWRSMSACALCLGLMLAVGPAAGAPVLTIDEAEFDFGYVPQNSKISHVFSLQNTGNDPLHITRVVPGCGCTKAPLKKSNLAPGETTELEIILSTKRYNRRITKRPRLEFDGEARPKHATIHAHVVPRPDSTYPITIKPYKLDLSQFGQTVRDRMKFTITNVSNLDLTVTAIDLPGDLFDLELPDRIPAGGRVDAEISLRSETLDMSFEKSITLQLDDSAQTRFTIPVKRTVHSPDKTVAAGR